MKHSLLLFAICTFFLSACASVPSELDTDNASRDISPQDVEKDVSVAGDTSLVWGGVIVNATNLQDHTQLEILSYPLKDSLRPDTGRTPTGRFLVKHLGYLEILDYAPGRKLTVIGRVEELQNQKVGEASYNFPVMQDEKIHLWSERTDPSEPRINFGFGVILTN